MIFLLHGFTGSPTSWENVQARLPSNGSTALRLIGHGSDWESFRTKSFIDEVRRLGSIIAGFEGLHHVCGYSLGARLALALLAEYPYLFSGGTLIGVHPGLESAVDKAKRANEDAMLATKLREGQLEGFVDAWESLPLFESQRILDGTVLADQRRTRLSNDAQGLAYCLDTVGLAKMPDYKQALAISKLPVTLFVGSLDKKFMDLATELDLAWPRVDVMRVDGVGHNVLLEAPNVVSEHLAGIGQKLRSVS